MSELNRKTVNDEIGRIIDMYIPAIRDSDEVASTVAALQMERDLKAHMDATVEAALAEGAGS